MSPSQGVCGSRARREFYSEIDIPGRFAAHLYGHMHEGASRSTALGGGASRNTLQGASLFGLDEYEAADGRRLERLHGYSAGRVEIDPAKARAQIKVFPRRMLDGKLGRRIERDQENYMLDERGSFTIDVPLYVPAKAR